MPKTPQANLATRITRAQHGEPCRLILLRLGAWNRACDAAGLLSIVQRANALGMSRQQVNLVQNRRRTPGVGFVVAALRLFPDMAFDDLFATYDNTADVVIEVAS